MHKPLFNLSSQRKTIGFLTLRECELGVMVASFVQNQSLMFEVIFVQQFSYPVAFMDKYQQGKDVDLHHFFINIKYTVANQLTTEINEWVLAWHANSSTTVHFKSHHFSIQHQLTANALLQLHSQCLAKSQIPQYQIIDYFHWESFLNKERVEGSLVGLVGDSLDLGYSFVQLNTLHLAFIRRHLEDSQTTIQQVIFANSARSLLYTQHHPEVVVIDINTESTTTSLESKGKIYHLQVYPFGTLSLTKAVALMFNINLPTAQHLLDHFGFLALIDLATVTKVYDQLKAMEYTKKNKPKIDDSLGVMYEWIQTEFLSNPSHQVLLNQTLTASLYHFIHQTLTEIQHSYEHHYPIYLGGLGAHLPGIENFMDYYYQDWSFVYQNASVFQQQLNLLQQQKRFSIRKGVQLEFKHDALLATALYLQQTYYFKTDLFQSQVKTPSRTHYAELLGQWLDQRYPWLMKMVRDYT